MNKEFSQFNFNVIDIIPKGALDILITIRGITISKVVICEMGFPPYVRMLVDSENMVFAMQACKPTDENAYKFSKPKGEQTKPIYCNVVAVRNIIRNLMVDSWSDIDSYRAKGTYYKDAKAMVFNLQTATLWENHHLQVKQI